MLRRSLLAIGLLMTFALGHAVAHEAETGHEHHQPPHGFVYTDRHSPVKLEKPSEEESFTFAIFGDRTGGLHSGLRVLEKAVAEINAIGPDLVMTVGDLVQGYNQRNEWLMQMGEFKLVMNRLVVPWFPVAGNHDVYWRGADRPENEHDGD